MCHILFWNTELESRKPMHRRAVRKSNSINRDDSQTEFQLIGRNNEKKMGKTSRQKIIFHFNDYNSVGCWWNWKFAGNFVRYPQNFTVDLTPSNYFPGFFFFFFISFLHFNKKKKKSSSRIFGDSHFYVQTFELRNANASAKDCIASHGFRDLNLCL